MCAQIRFEGDLFSSVGSLALTHCATHFAGLWVELQLAYNGTLQMTLQTKFNLSKLGKEGGQDTDWLTEPGNSQLVITFYRHTL